MTTTHSTRARPMAPDQRRRSIAEAVVPLLVSHGASITTRQMAEAAGVAEGTIFRVFPDKCAVVHEAVKVCLDPKPVWDALAAIEPGLAFDEQARQAVTVLLRRLEEVMAVLSVLRSTPGGEHRRSAGPPPFVAEANAVITHALTGLFERNRDQLRVEPARAALMLRGLVLACGHLGMAGEQRPTAEELVDVFLHGIVEARVEELV